MKNRIDKIVDSPLCRLCKEKGESVSHITSECSKLAQREYKRRHDGVAKYLHWELCGKHQINRGERWYEHTPEGTVENGSVKILWDFMIQCDHYIEHRKPDIVVIDKIEKKCLIIDIAIPGDNRIMKKEEEKLEKYEELRQEIIRLWKMKKVIVVPIVIGALGVVTSKINDWLQKLDISVRVEHLQKTALLGSSHILQKHLNAS